MKWFLKVCMALSAAFRRCCPAGTNWKSIPCAVMYSASSVEHSLSRRWSLSRL